MESTSSQLQWIGPYEISTRLDSSGAVVGAQLGVGGMGEVYLCSRPDHGRPVAVKIARAELVGDRQLLAQFLDEISVTMSLEHPNIVRAYDSGTHDGRPYLVMQHVDSGTLRHRSNRDKFREPRRLLELMQKVVKAVAAAHEDEILHGDLSPANVLVDSHGEPFVSDFGLARTPWQISRKLQLIAVSPGYTAPEALTGTHSEASDIYSLGAIFLELVAEAEAANRDMPGRFARRERSRMLTNLRAVCETAKRPEPETRHASAAAMLGQLRTIAEGGTIVPLPWFTRTIHWIEAYPWIAAALVLTLAAAGYLFHEAVRLIDDDHAERLAATLRTTCEIVSLRARLFETELKRMKDSVRLAAGDPAIRRLVNHARLDEAPPELEVFDTQFDSAFVLKRNGDAAAHWPAYEPQLSNGGNFAWCDYYVGLMESIRTSGGDVYVSRAYRFPRKDGVYRFAISTPLYERGELIGVLVVTKDSGAALDDASLPLEGEGNSSAALLSLEDKSNPNATLPTERVVIVAPTLKKGAIALQRVKPEDIACGVNAICDCRHAAHPANSIIADPLHANGEEVIVARAALAGTDFVLMEVVPIESARAARRALVDRLLLRLGLPGAWILILLTVLVVLANQRRAGR